MIKEIIRNIFRSVGYDIVKLKDNGGKTSVRSNKLELYDTATGKYYLPVEAVGDGIANAIKANVIFDKNIFETAKKFIAPHSAVLDLGANFGQMTILFSKLLNNKGKVYSFEADDFIFSVLEKNIAENQCGNVVPVFGVVSDKKDETHYYPEQDFERFQTYGSYGPSPKIKVGREVKTLTIDSLDIPEKISFMKIDIQGYDLLAMKGAVETIKRNKMPIIFEFEWLFQDDLELSFQEYVDFVKIINYRFERVIDAQNFLILPVN